VVAVDAAAAVGIAVDGVVEKVISDGVLLLPVMVLLVYVVRVPRTNNSVGWLALTDKDIPVAVVADSNIRIDSSQSE
jgi:hypothetical protein